MRNFNSEKELAVITEIRRLAKRKAYRVSKLNELRSEIVTLRKADASLNDIATWLRLNTKIRADRSTISRYLRQLPELQTYHSEDNNNG